MQKNIKRWLLTNLVLASAVVSCPTLAQNATSVKPALTTPTSSTAPDWRTLGIVSGTSLAIAGVGLGIGFSAVAATNYADFKNERNRLIRETPIGSVICPEREKDARCQKMIRFNKATHKNQTIGTTSFIVGGLATVGALVLVFWKPEENTTTNNKTNLTIMPSVNGAFVTGTF